MTVGLELALTALIGVAVPVEHRVQREVPGPLGQFVGDIAAAVGGDRPRGDGEHQGVGPSMGMTARSLSGIESWGPNCCSYAVSAAAVWIHHRTRLPSQSQLALVVSSGALATYMVF